MVCPVLGFHAGEVQVAFEKVKRLGWLPLASVTHSSGLPAMDEEKTICAPSGDHAGALFVPRNRAKDSTLPASIEYMQICALVIVPFLEKQVNAMREASGDHRGVSAMECREVTGCWFAPS